ncbi:hypothetical protein D3C72_2291950 [compost metagenome]
MLSSTLPPLPLSDPSAMAGAADTSNVPPVLTVTAEFAARLPVEPRASVPPLTVRPPVNVLAPFRICVSAPALTRPPTPEMTPE